MVAGKDEDVTGLLAADGINILINGISGALIPVLRNAHLWRKYFDEISQAHQYGPAATNVAIEAERFVLREDEDAAQVAVQAIGERDVNDAVHAAEWDSGFRAVARQWPQALSLAACQEHAQSVAHRSCHRNFLQECPGRRIILAAEKEASIRREFFGRRIL